MKEREHPGDELWQQDVAIGEGLIAGEPTSIRLRLHASPEDYRGRDELLPMPMQVGPRMYFLARPYILTPDIQLTVGFPRDTDPAGQEPGYVGEVLASDWVGMRHTEIGHAQAWGYPADGTLVLWECYLFESYRGDDPVVDQNLIVLWQGFERTVGELLPGLERIVTPSWEDIYDLDRWRDFLRSQGYVSLTNRAFVKEFGG